MWPHLKLCGPRCKIGTMPVWFRLVAKKENKIKLNYLMDYKSKNASQMWCAMYTEKQINIIKGYCCVCVWIKCIPEGEKLESELRLYYRKIWIVNRLELSLDKDGLNIPLSLTKFETSFFLTKRSSLFLEHSLYKLAIANSFSVPLRCKSMTQKCLTQGSGCHSLEMQSLKQIAFP